MKREYLVCFSIGGHLGYEVRTKVFSESEVSAKSIAYDKLLKSIGVKMKKSCLEYVRELN